IWGAYLPVIHALRDSLDILQVQLYNSGSMYGIDGGIYTQGTADFIVAMTEAVIRGFNTAGGAFAGLPANKVAVALPSCPSAAGGGYTSPAVVASAINYLRGVGPKPGTYTLVQAGGYPDLRGMMTWSVNWDKVTSCNATTYEYAQSFQNIFATQLPVTLTSFNAKRIQNSVALWWETSEEVNVDYYQVEHSLDGINFNVLGKVAANNTGIIQQHYEYNHSNPNPQINYYRLNMVDIDGSTAYSNIISVSFNTINPFVFPNPVASQLQINNRESSGPYRISNMQGKIVQQGLYVGEPVLVNTLPPGIYYLSIDNQVSKFVKE
ncbi:MAG: T9SS type A sorting domain-containing protein, partial [Saprospiraceae bacterium]|nr:T9SS type A sorting domain-containing protein [Saprospiraceae bacterium]